MLYFDFKDVSHQNKKFGMIPNNTMSWKYHLQRIKSSARLSKLNFLKNWTAYPTALMAKHSKKIYTSVICPKLEYGIVAYSSASKHQPNRILEYDTKYYAMPNTGCFLHKTYSEPLL